MGVVLRDDSVGFCGIARADVGVDARDTQNVLGKIISAERRLQNTEMDLLYRGAVAGARNQAAGPQYVIFPGAITGSSLVTEPWLRDLADDAG